MDDGSFRTGIARRDEFLARVPSWYRGEIHLAATVLGALALATVALVGVRPTWAELAVAPLAFLGGNFFEWCVHRGPMHNLGFPEILYRRHTQLHHASFTHEHMAVRSARELRLVLFPWAAILGAALAAGIVGAALALAWSPAAGRIVFAVLVGYYLLYELCHTAFHLPPGSWLARRSVVRWLRVTHTRHHDPRLMRRRNFNVTFPICDALLGTLDRTEEERP